MDRNANPWVLTVGETLVRFSPPGNARLEQSLSFDSHVAGAESNFAIALNAMGTRVRWVSAIGDNPLSRRILRHIRGFGVDVSRVVRKPAARQGIFFLEYGPSPRPLEVHYDRKGSAASLLGPEDMRDEWYDGVGHVHLTGITPALSDSCRDLTGALLEEAIRRELTLSFDINYRRGLWSPEEAARCLTPLLSGVHLLIAKLDDAQLLYGCGDSPEAAARQLLDRFNCSAVAITAGANEAIVMDSSGAVFHSEPYAVQPVDKLGAGDAFAAGMVYGYLHGQLQNGLDYAQAMAAWKYSIPGDDALFTREEIDRLIARGPETLRR